MVTLSIRERLQNDLIESGSALPSVQLTRNKATSLCSGIAHGAFNCAKRVGQGVAAAVVITPITLGTTFLAQRIGLIQQREDYRILMKESITNLVKIGIPFKNGAAESVAKATCVLQEYVAQWNHAFQDFPEHQKTVFGIKSSSVSGVAIEFPIFEELLFRGLIQDVLLKRIPKYIVSRVAPGKESALDSNIAKVARITLTAALFSAYHLQNVGIFDDAYVSMQLVATFIMGIGFGALKESKVGLPGAIGAHMTNNLIALFPVLWRC